MISRVNPDPVFGASYNGFAAAPATRGQAAGLIRAGKNQT